MAVTLCSITGKVSYFAPNEMFISSFLNVTIEDYVTKRKGIKAFTFLWGGKAKCWRSCFEISTGKSCAMHEPKYSTAPQKKAPPGTDWCRRLKLISYCCSASANQIFLRLLLQTLVDCLVPFCVACTPLWLAVASLASVRIVVLCYMLCSYARRMLHEHSNILSVSNLLSLAWHSHGSIVCVWFVVAHKKNADIQLILLMLKQNPTAYCHQPSFSFHCTNVLIPIYIRSARQHSFDFYIDVCSFRPNCHACIFSVLYGVLELFINKIMFYLKDTFVWGTHGSFKLRCFVFFCFILFPVWENVCLHAMQELAHF